MEKARIGEFFREEKKTRSANTLIEVPGEGCATEWCEPVSDEHYDKL